MTPHRLPLFAVAAALALAGCSEVPEVTEPEPVGTASPAPADAGDPGTAWATTATDLPTTAPAPTTRDGATGTASGEGAPPALDPQAVNRAALTALQRAEEAAEGVAYQLDRRDDGSWRVDVAVGAAEVEVTVAADGSQVVSRLDRGPLDADDAAGVAAATVPARRAVETALQGDDGFVEEVELDREGAGFRWVVHLERPDDDLEVHVDVTTGEVLRVDL